GLEQVPLGGLLHPGGRQIADIAVGPVQDQCVRLGAVAAVDPCEVEGGALRAALRLGVPSDAQTVVEHHHACAVDGPGVQELGRACSEQGSNSGESSRAYCSGTSSASRSASCGASQPAAVNILTTSPSGSFSRPRRT